jgi:hypothetical protein
VTAATAAAAASTARRAGTAGGFGSAARYRRTEDGKLDFGVLARAFRAGNLLIAIDNDFFEGVLAVFADVFVDGHGVRSCFDVDIIITKSQLGDG